MCNPYDVTVCPIPSQASSWRPRDHASGYQPWRLRSDLPFQISYSNWSKRTPDCSDRPLRNIHSRVWDTYFSSNCISLRWVRVSIFKVSPLWHWCFQQSDALHHFSAEVIHDFCLTPSLRLDLFHFLFSSLRFLAFQSLVRSLLILMKSAWASHPHWLLSRSFRALELPFRIDQSMTA